MSKVKNIILQIWVIYAFFGMQNIAHATVIEFGTNGTIAKVHEAVDYLSKNRKAKFKSAVFIPKTSDHYDAIIIKLAKKHGIDENLVRSVISVESAFKERAVSHAGAQGLMQLIPATAKRFGVKDSFNPSQNIEGGIKYLKFLSKRFNGDLDLILAGYNAGEGAVDKYEGIPPYTETINYVSKVKATLDALK